MQEIWEQIKKVLWDFINGYGKTLALGGQLCYDGRSIIKKEREHHERNHH
jgi:hypothetical protein